MNLKDFYINGPELVARMPDCSWFTHCQIFDNLLCVANKATASFILKTTAGLIVIDAIYPKQEMFDAIISAIEDIGWHSEDIKKLVITHGHFDHCGCGKWIVNKYGAETYLSAVDDAFWENKPFFQNKPETWKDFAIDFYVADGDEICLGNTSIKVLETPGHTPGGLSFIFPVYDNGIKHMAGMWGGTNPPSDIAGIVQYLQSLDYFCKETRKNNCDVVLCNHPDFDMGYTKIEYSKNRTSHMPNVYVMSEDDFQNFNDVFRTLAYEKLLAISSQK